MEELVQVHEQAVAQDLVRGMLAKFDAVVADPASDSEHLHHRLTWQYFKTDEVMRRELDAFAQGIPMEQLPKVTSLAAKWRFTPTVPLAILHL